MLEKLLGTKIYGALEACFDISKVQEVRLRVNAPIIVCYKGINICLKNPSGDLVFAKAEDIARVVSEASNHSLYTVENQIKQAFITAECGYRIGLSGEMVGDSVGGFRSIKNIYSVCIRVPHLVLGCSASVYKFLKSENGIRSTLVISPPGAGKTTILRDLCHQMSSEEVPQNILVVDERYELAGVKNGQPSIDIGGCCDILSGASKSFGFGYGIRSLRPDVIVTDELGTLDDVDGVAHALSSGVKVLASVHADSINMLLHKPILGRLIDQRLFERYVVLSNKRGVGTCEGVFDENLKCLYY